jgi:hypothetical protein
MMAIFVNTRFSAIYESKDLANLAIDATSVFGR